MYIVCTIIGQKNGEKTKTKSPTTLARGAGGGEYFSFTLSHKNRWYYSKGAYLTIVVYGEGQNSNHHPNETCEIAEKKMDRD